MRQQIQYLQCIQLLAMLSLAEVEGQISDSRLSKVDSRNLFVLNIVCRTERNLILNSIEVTQESTIVNFTFINTSLAYRDSAFIFAAIDDVEQSFYIEDSKTQEKYYANGSTIGSSAKTGTYLRLGEAKRFKLLFPSIGGAKRINIKEGMQGADWSFYNIDLPKSSELTNDNFLNDSSFQKGLTLLSDKEFEKASVIILDRASRNNHNDFMKNLAGVISYVLGDSLGALAYFKEANALRPTEHQYYFNMYFLFEATGNMEEALKSISAAIQMNKDQPEYFHYRAMLYIDMKYWKEAVDDLDRYINSDRAITGMSYFLRGVAKSFLQDSSACTDFKKAYSLEKSDKNKQVISGWYDKVCQ